MKKHGTMRAPLFTRGRAKRRRHTGAIVNPRMTEPDPPGPWVDAERCSVCTDAFDDYRSYPSWQGAAARIRAASKADGDAGGGFRSRGPVLWVMHVMKLEAWYLDHAFCGLKEPEDNIPF